MHDVYIHYMGREGFVCLFWLHTLAWESDRQSRAHLPSAAGLPLQCSAIPVETVSKVWDVSLTMRDPPGFGADVYFVILSAPESCLGIHWRSRTGA